MKTKICMVALLAVALLMTACQSTPESEIVVNKDQTNMVDKASVTDKPLGTLKEKTGAPEEFKLEISEKGKLKFSANAKVTVPNESKIPIVRVEAADFSQEQATAYFDYLCGDMEMYRPNMERTKSEIEQSILSLKKSISEANKSDEQYIDSMKKSIEQLEKEYENAPESIAEVRADGTLYNIETKDPSTGGVFSTFEGLIAQQKEKEGEIGCSFSIQNNSDQKESVVFSRDENGNVTSAAPNIKGAMMIFRRYSDRWADNRDGSEVISESYVPDVQVSGSLKLTAAKAKEQVQALLEGTKTDMQISKILLVKYEDYPMPDANAQESTSPSQMPQPVSKYAYKFICERKVDNIPCTEINGVAYIPMDETKYSMRDASMVQEGWKHEKYYVNVNDEGIVSFEWTSPMKILDKKVEDSTLKTFSEIQGIFEKMMAVKYEFNLQDEYLDETKYDIDKVELGLMRVMEQNSIGTGLLVPAWRFYGNRTMIYKTQEGQEPQQPHETYGCWLTLNAVDGALIDEQQGY